MGASFHHTFELQSPTPRAANPKFIQTDDRGHRRGSRQGQKPSGLVEKCSNRKTQVHSFFIPDAVIISCRYMEGIIAGRQLGVSNIASASDLHPIIIQRREAYFEPYLFGSK